MLDLIQKGKQGGPPRVVIYGQEGIGKSTFCANAPSPIFVPTEDGLGQIECDAFPLSESYSQFMGHLEALTAGEHEYKTLAIDSLDWLEKLIWADVCREKKVASIADVPYGKGPEFAMSQWKEVLLALNYIRKHLGMAIVLVAHAKVENFKDPEGSIYDRYTLALHKTADAYICQWADAILFGTKKKRIHKEELGFNKVRTTAVAIGADGGDRILRTVESPACNAKSRYGHPNEIPLSWEAFAEYLN